jgi:hypothetical protein
MNFDLITAFAQDIEGLADIAGSKNTKMFGH